MLTLKPAIEIAYRGKSGSINCGLARSTPTKGTSSEDQDKHQVRGKEVMKIKTAIKAGKKA
jgi:hypothetical protein